MPIFSSKKIIDEIIANNGHYYDDPQALQVSEYTTPEGNPCWHVAYMEQDIVSLYSSPYVHDVKVLWSRP